MKRLILLGAGCGSREVLMLVQLINKVSPEWEVLGFVDETKEKIGSIVDGFPVFGPDEEFDKDTYGASGLMDSKLRERVLTTYVVERGHRMATLIAPDAMPPEDFVAGSGTVVMPKTVISFDVQLGRGVLVLWGATLGHHLRVGEFSSILSQAAITGKCSIGARTILGARSCVSNGVKIGANCLIGVGTTVLRDLPHGKSLVSLPRQILSDI